MCFHRRDLCCQIKEITAPQGLLSCSTLDVSDHLTCINSTPFRLRHDQAIRILFTAMDHDMGEEG
uniref:Uncharacterized protein n=1 Tax=Arundo donax TaxID=35708 RepID=A0A0A9D3J2_ARUDO